MITTNPTTLINSHKEIKINFVKYITFIVIWSILTHGLLLLNDGIYWDGWLIYTYLVDKDWNSLDTLFKETGGILTIKFLFYRFLRYFPAVVFVFKFVAFLSITLSGILSFLIFMESGLCSRKDSLYIALLSLSFPAYQISIEQITTIILISYCLFLSACYLAIRAEKINSNYHALFRFFALVLFTLSFTINSLLVFYGGFFFIYVYYIYKHKFNKHSLKFFLRWFMLFRLDYVILPFLFWLISRTFFPPHGLYINHNRISISISNIIKVYNGFICNAVYGQLYNAFSNLISQPILILTTFLIAFSVYSIFSLHKYCFFEQNIKQHLLLLIFGIFLLLLGIFPYAVVGKIATISGWRTRHALLVGLPIAIILVPVIRLLFADNKGVISKLGFSFLVILMLALNMSTMKYYFSWQARWVKDRSIMANLFNIKEAKEISVFWIDDQFPVGGEARYRFYEWSCMFKYIWGDERHLGLDLRRHSLKTQFKNWPLPFFTRRYKLSEFDPDGSQAILTIRRGHKSYNDIALSTIYLYNKYFRKKYLYEFLKDVTELQLEPIIVLNNSKIILSGFPWGKNGSLSPRPKSSAWRKTWLNVYYTSSSTNLSGNQ